MTDLSCRAALMVLGVALWLFLSSCSAGDAAGDLEAAPWPAVIASDKQTLPEAFLNGALTDITPEDVAKLSGMAEEGVTFAAVILAQLYQHEFQDMKKAVRWLRVAVENGDVDSAMTLGGLYFPVGGSLGRENFAYKPDVVLGYVWYAIGLSGMKMLEEQGGETRMDMERAQEMTEGLRTLLLPSERLRVAGILSKWPENMPPDEPLEPVSGDNAAPENTKSVQAGDVPSDESAIAETIRRWVNGNGEARDSAAVWALLQPSPELGRALRTVFDQMRQRADAGDEEAELVVAWCRFHGLGTAADAAAAMPVIEARAEAGHPEACLLTAIWALDKGDKDRAAGLTFRAAEKGHVRAMLLASQIMRDRGDKKEAARWMEKAAEAGSFAAIEEMLSFAESARDWKRLVRWLTVLTIRASDPAMSYRCRMLIAYVASDIDEETLRAAMAEGEEWHDRYPALP